MNIVILVGRLTRDPDIKRKDDGSISHARYTLAVDRPKASDGQPTADFISCVAFGKSGEFVENFLYKGIKIAIQGRIQTGSYTNKEGERVYTTDVVVDRHEFCEGKGSRKEDDESRDAALMEQAENENGFMDIPEGIDEALPFK